MKRIGYVYDKMLDKEFIKATIKKASKNKTNRRLVKRVLANIDEYTDKIYEMIETENIVMRETHHREIYENGKTRKITVSPFYPNQILDYILVETTKDIIRKPMYIYCVGNVNKRGIIYGKKAVERNYKKYKYYMKLDIKHFYENVDVKVLITIFERKIKDKKFIEFMRKVMEKDGLPIGTYYSQWFSNFFLCDFDHYIKEKLKIGFYIRNVDDMVFCDNNKKKLKQAYYETKRYLFNIGLWYKYIPTITRRVNFLGYIFEKSSTRLRHNIFYRTRRTVMNISKHLCMSLVNRFISYYGWLKSIKIGYGYYINRIRPIIRIGTLKRIVSQGGI